MLRGSRPGGGTRSFNHHTDLPHAVEEQQLATPYNLCEKCSVICAESKLLWELPDVFENRLLPRLEYDENLEEFESPETESFPWLTSEELINSHLRDCHLCSIAGHVIKENRRDGPVEFKDSKERFFERGQHLRMNVISDKLEQRCVIEVGNGGDTATDTICVLEVYTASDERHEPVGEQFDVRLAYWTGSNASLDLIGSWLKACDESHPECQQRESEGGASYVGPTRLLEASGSTGSLRVSLCCDVTKAGRHLYVTLSHSWGRDDILRLTRESFSKFQDGIEVSVLPKTYADAITAAWRLGFRFLWIDSLCIIQNSEDDWRKEASRMGAVYKGSVFTIAALGASSHEDCFAWRDPLVFRPCLLFGPSGRAYCAQRYAEEYALEEFIFEGYPLLSRAWVVQERLLSRRVIYFGGPELIWECCASTKSETWPSGLNKIQLPEDGYTEEAREVRSSFEKCLTPSEKWGGKEAAAFFRAWHRTVDRYAQARLTRESDRAVAISGIANYMESSTGLRYLSGLWARWLWPQLCWYVSHGHGERAPLDNLPTWSWISVSGTIDHEITDREFASAVRSFKQASITLADDGVFASSEVLKMVTTIIPLARHRPEILLMCSKDDEIRWTPDVDVSNREKLFVALIVCLEYDNDYEPVCHISNHHRDAGCGHTFTELGLVLEPCPSHNASFKRVGFLHNNFNRDGRGFGTEIFDQAVEERAIYIH